MSLRPSVDCPEARGADPQAVVAWFVQQSDEVRGGHGSGPGEAAARSAHRIPAGEAERLRRVIEAAIGDVFGVPRGHLATQSRGKAPVALARQAAMYLAHVSCGLSLTDVGHVFARDRTTVAHACAVIEDRRDDPVFDRALELMEWIVPTLVGRGLHRRHHDI